MATAIFIFLTSDGLVPGKRQQPTVTLYLTDVSGNNHSLGESDSYPFRATRGKSSFDPGFSSMSVSDIL